MRRPGREPDPKVTDLRRYRRDREQAERRPPSKPKPATGGGFLGSNPKAALILVLVILALAAIYILPRLVR